MLEEKLFEPRNLTTLVVSYSVLDLLKETMIQSILEYTNYGAKTIFTLNIFSKADIGLKMAGQGNCG